jgi:GNAT superfamily N-acetyltransferase
MTGKLEISTINDLRGLAKCHKASFPNALSTKLGNRFIMKMLSWYILDERGILFHIKHEDQYLGYCGGILIQQPGLPGAASSITQHSFNSFISSFILKPWLIIHPENLKRIAFIKKNLLSHLGIEKKSNPAIKRFETFEPTMGLVVIGVPAFQQHKGYGSRMLEEFERIAKEKGFKKISLSVKPTNMKAIKAYKKNQWQEGKSENDSLNMYKNI